MILAIIGLQQIFFGLFGLFWPLMSFFRQKISFWVKINCKRSLSTNLMLKTVFEVHCVLKFNFAVFQLAVIQITPHCQRLFTVGI
jgi:hypothetical protein